MVSFGVVEWRRVPQALRCAALLLCWAILTAQGAPAATSSDRLASAIAKRSREFNGAAIIAGLIDHGRTEIFKVGSTGTARPLDERTIFEIGSLTKTFTGTLLAVAASRGEVNVDEAIAKYLPAGFPVPSRNGKEITVLDLATQTSGLPRLPTNLSVTADDPYAAYTTNDLESFLSSYALERDPGSQFEYSNVGGSLVGFALANRAGTSYGDLLRTRVTTPLGMSETFLNDAPPSLAALVAVGHDGDGGVAPPWHFPDALEGAGALRSSLFDLLRYLRAGLGPGPLATALSDAQTPKRSIPGGGIGYFWITTSIYQVTWHDGGTAGFRSFIGFNFDHQGIVLLANCACDMDDIGFHFLNETYQLADYPDLRLAEGALAGYVGTYTVSGISGHAIKRDHRLWWQPPDSGAYPLYARGKDAFYGRRFPVTFQFQRDSAGKVTGVSFTFYGQTAVAVKQ